MCISSWNGECVDDCPVCGGTESYRCYTEYDKLEPCQIDRRGCDLCGYFEEREFRPESSETFVFGFRLLALEMPSPDYIRRVAKAAEQMQEHVSPVEENGEKKGESARPDF